MRDIPARAAAKQARAPNTPAVRAAALQKRAYLLSEVRPTGYPDAVIFQGGNHDGNVNPVAHSLTDAYALLGTIAAQGRGPKITVFKMKRRKGYRRKIGHRQDYTEILVDRIES